MKPYSGQAVANAAGVAEIDLVPPAAYQWLVYQIGLSAGSSTSSTASVYLNQRFMCGSNTGNADAADGSPIPVRTGDTLRIVWNNCSQGAICSAQILVEEYLMGQPLPQQ